MKIDDWNRTVYLVHRLTGDRDSVSISRLKQTASVHDHPFNQMLYPANQFNQHSWHLFFDKDAAKQCSELIIAVRALLAKHPDPNIIKDFDAFTSNREKVVKETQDNVQSLLYDIKTNGVIANNQKVDFHLSAVVPSNDDSLNLVFGFGLGRMMIIFKCRPLWKRKLVNIFRTII